MAHPDVFDGGGYGLAVGHCGEPLLDLLMEVLEAVLQLLQDAPPVVE